MYKEISQPERGSLEQWGLVTHLTTFLIQLSWQPQRYYNGNRP